MITKEDIIYDPTIPEFAGYHCMKAGIKIQPNKTKIF